MTILDGNKPWNGEPLALTIGFFDGVHRGHQDLLRQLCDKATNCGLLPAAITFPQSPASVLNPEKRVPLLTTVGEKRAALSTTGIKLLIELPFTRELSVLTAEQFMSQYLKDRYRAALLLMGYDHHFGHNAQAGLSQYVDCGKQCGLQVFRARQYFTPEGLRVSSTLVRGLLQCGDVETAATLLGRNYTVSGTVVSGRQLGRKLGFPTANIVPDSADKLIPAHGVYAIRLHVGGDSFDGMLNIGTRPTVDESGQTSIEANLFRFKGNLYGLKVTAEFIARLRDEHKFSSLESLRNQLASDAVQIRHRLNKDK